MPRGTALFIVAIVLAGLALQRPAVAARARDTGGMQLKLIVPPDTAVGDRLPIDVSYRGAVPDTFEMYLDGSLVAKRQMTGAGPRGVVSFSLDTMLLAEGMHSVQIRCTDSQGQPVVASGRIRVPGVDLSAPVRIAYPANGVEVNGAVAIRVGLSDSLARQSPYVSFFVDRELKVLRNYPPYEYVWDTTTASNGWHLLEAWTQLPDAASPFKARPVHVNVNNSGGATKKQDAIEDLRTAPTIDMAISPQKSARGTLGDASLSVSGRTPVLRGTPRGYGDATGVRALEPTGRRIAARPGEARASVGSTRPAVSSRAPVLRGSAGGYAGSMSARAQEPADRQVASLPASMVAATPRKTDRAAAGRAFPDTRASFRSAALKPSRISASMAGGAVEIPAGKMMIASRPIATTPDLTQLGLPADSFSSTVRVRPGEDLQSVSRRTGVSAAEISQLNAIQPSGTLTAGQKLIVPQSGVFSVAYDGSQIAFDVPPRIERGIALAPFRSLFEYAGGTLYWYSQTKRVHAINSNREIEIQIGSSKALVNNHPYALERRAYIDRGRTIVPMSFVGDVLDVTMSYDAQSGRLLLQSKK